MMGKTARVGWVGRNWKQERDSINKDHRCVTEAKRHFYASGDILTISTHYRCISSKNWLEFLISDRMSCTRDHKDKWFIDYDLLSLLWNASKLSISVICVCRGDGKRKGEKKRNRLVLREERKGRQKPSGREGQWKDGARGGTRFWGEFPRRVFVARPQSLPSLATTVWRLKGSRWWDGS